MNETERIEKELGDDLITPMQAVAQLAVLQAGESRRTAERTAGIVRGIGAVTWLLFFAVCFDISLSVVFRIWP